MTIIESNSNLIGIHRKLKHKWARLTDLEFANNLMTRSYQAGNRIKYWGRIGAFGGGIFGLFFGSMFIFIPRDEPLLVTGLLAAWSFLRLAGAMVVGGLSAVGAEYIISVFLMTAFSNLKPPSIPASVPTP